VLLFIFVGFSAATANIFVDNREQRYQLVERKDVFATLAIIVLALIAFRSFSTAVLRM
jgi:hypothetical protein